MVATTSRFLNVIMMPPPRLAATPIQTTVFLLGVILASPTFADGAAQDIQKLEQGTSQLAKQQKDCEPPVLAFTSTSGTGSNVEWDRIARSADASKKCLSKALDSAAGLVGENNELMDRLSRRSGSELLSEKNARDLVAVQSDLSQTLSKLDGLVIYHNQHTKKMAKDPGAPDDFPEDRLYFSHAGYSSTPLEISSDGSSFGAVVFSD